MRASPWLAGLVRASQGATLELQCPRMQNVHKQNLPGIAYWLAGILHAGVVCADTTMSE